MKPWYEEAARWLAGGRASVFRSPSDLLRLALAERETFEVYRRQATVFASALVELGREDIVNRELES